jgi:hypothetical protein
MVPDQNNVIDTTNYAYFLVAWDECGSDAAAGLAWVAAFLSQSNITTSAPG